MTALVRSLHEQPTVDALAHLYDVTGPAVYTWALDKAPRPLAERIVVDTYTNLWLRSSTYSTGVPGWSWVRAQALTALQHHRAPDPGVRPDAPA
ncbi:hypothetical protein [Auraticoccus monumenti]|uniref:hypothetical protein n=1 Tax=Auraticoccus monumenti TaxID=675864 RepID=UPI0012FAC4EE|nr:hypothetical protein [Auraticoccus monumenti]